MTAGFDTNADCEKLSVNAKVRPVLSSRHFAPQTIRWALCALVLVCGTRATQNAVANGDTRTITIMHMHTKEETTVTFRRDGRYDGPALDKLNWALRDWRNDEPIKMDPRLFDVAWEVHRSVGSGEAFHVVSAYRSPGTNSMLRRRSRGVAKHSQHMLGKAMDFYLPDISSSQVRQVGMQLQRGGVGYYPSSANQFIHLDVGSVRSWPRMSRDQLARIFPTGKTVHLPSDGEPLDGYETAKAEILARGGSVAGYAAADLDEGAIIAGGSRSSFWSFLFGAGSDEDEAKPARGRRSAVASRQATPPSSALAYANADNDPLGRFGASQPTQQAPLRERVAATSSRRNSEPEKSGAEDARVASLNAISPPPAVSAAAQANAAAQIKAAAENQTKAAPAQLVVSLINAPIPVARPRNIAMPAAAPEVVQMAALATSASVPDAIPATVQSETLSSKMIPAPTPPLRPLAMAALPADPQMTTSTIAPAQKPAEPPGRLINIAHGGPPLRPSAIAANLVAMAPASAPVQALNVTPSERDALSQLFARTQPAKGVVKPKITTTKSMPVALKDGVMTSGETPAVSAGFIKSNPNDVRTDKFTGPAVRPLPTTFIQQ